MDKERQVRYNHRRSKLNNRANEWWFLIVNQNREIEDIKQKIYVLLAPITEEFKGLEGSIKKTGLRYELISFESEKKVESYEINKIYSKVSKDWKLYFGARKDRLEKYITHQFE